MNTAGYNLKKIPSSTFTCYLDEFPWRNAICCFHCMCGTQTSRMDCRTWHKSLECFIFCK